VGADYSSFYDIRPVTSLVFMYLASGSSTFRRLLSVASQAFLGRKLGRSRLCTLPVRVFRLFRSSLPVEAFILYLRNCPDGSFGIDIIAVACSWSLASGIHISVQYPLLFEQHVSQVPTEAEHAKALILTFSQGAWSPRLQKVGKRKVLIFEQEVGRN